LPLINIELSFFRDWHKMFYYNDGENEIGPFSRERILKLKEGALIGDRTLIRRADDRFWLPFNEMTELSSVHHQKGWTRKIKPNESQNKDLSDQSNYSSGYHKSHQFEPFEKTDPASVKVDKVEKADGVSGWVTGPPSPWRRFGARALDIGFNGAFGFFLFAMAFYALAPASADSFFLVFQAQGARVLDTLATALMASLVGGALIGERNDVSLRRPLRSSPSRR
jgi:hypothetical protein